MISRSDGKDFPRALPHGKEYLSKERIKIAGKDALLCQSPVFEIGRKKMISAEAFLVDQGRRFLILGFTTQELFNQFKPVFFEMLNTFQLDEWERELKKPKNLRIEVKRLVKASEALVERSNIKDENLYLALKNYRKACLLINLYDFRPEDRFRNKVINAFKKAQDTLDSKIADLNFQIGKGKKMNEGEIIFKAARAIMNLVPNPDDKRYQEAEKYYARYRNTYEDKFALTRR